jgi:hypothetical protein
VGTILTRKALVWLEEPESVAARLSRIASGGDSALNSQRYIGCGKMILAELEPFWYNIRLGEVAFSTVTAAFCVRLTAKRI